jgi:hypothetical protein
LAPNLVHPLDSWELEKYICPVPIPGILIGFACGGNKPSVFYKSY